MKISGTSIGNGVEVFSVATHFFKDTINQGTKEVAKNYVKTDVRSKDSIIYFFKNFPPLKKTLTQSSI
ncbi:hypothetical protein [Chryseobacterium sp.]|uniref:hypothetical protein n=1 Tax=Chryseobacterium sp. TaxID=1871047 RepID=UPI003890A0BA